MRDLAPKLPAIHTGGSALLADNQHLAAAIWQASHHSRIEAAEDVLDAQGHRLWPRGTAMSPELLERLADHDLRHPLELHLPTRAPVVMGWAEAALREACHAAPDLALALKPKFDAVLELLHSLALNPREQLLVAVMRHAEPPLLPHSIVVTALALAAGLGVGLEGRELRVLARAGLLHDVGLLYLPETSDHDLTHGQWRRHPMLSAAAAVELAGCSLAVGELITCSHERLDGSGYPGALLAPQLSLAARTLALAEAVADTLANPALGALHAAMAVRMVPREFDERLMSWVAAVARTAPLREPALPPGALPVGQRLRRLHATLSRAVVLLTLPVGESPEVRQAATLWLKRLAPLMLALNTSGVEASLGQGRDLTPETPAEAAELEALAHELTLRLQAFARAVAADRTRSAELWSSRLVHSLGQILHEPAAPAAVPPTPSPA